MSLTSELASAKTEEDVKDAYIKAIGLKGVSKNLVDIQTEEVWFEAKAVSTPSIVMFAQLLFYIRAAKKRGEALPAFLAVIDREKAALMPTEKALPLLDDKTIVWPKSGSQAGKILAGHIAPYVQAHIVEYTIAHDEAAFVKAVKDAIRLRKIIRTPISPDNLRQVFDRWVALVGIELGVANEADYAVLFFADIMHDGANEAMANLPARLLMTAAGPTFLLHGQTYELASRRGYDNFWAIYHRPPEQKHRHYLLERRDSLLPVDEQKFKGAYYTPLHIVDKAYDRLNRVLAKSRPEGSIFYNYDLASRMTTASFNSSGQGGMTFVHDALGRRTGETSPQGTVASQYDLAGRRTRVTLPGATSLFANYEYDVLGNATFIRENGAASGVGVLATYQYDSLSRRSSVTFGNGVVQGFTFDPVSRLATHTNDLASTVNDLTQTFSYNPASQIASVTRSNDLYAWTGHTNDNLSSTPNGLNQIGNVGAKAVTHDTKGNITGVGTDSYGYSSENFLVTGPASAALSYDPMGRLSQVTQGAATTRMGYDGLDRVAEYDAANAVQRRYIHGPGVDNPVTWYEGSGTTTRRFLSADERGSIVAVTDSAGAVLGLNKYDEYGVPQSTNLGKFGYTAQTWVPEVSLWHYKARFYRPDIGRFLQTDPIGYEAGMNLYAYVGNDPVNWTDPLGLNQERVDQEIVVNGPRWDPYAGFVDYVNQGSLLNFNNLQNILSFANSGVGWCNANPAACGKGGGGGNSTPQKVAKLNSCQAGFAASKLAARGLPTSHLGDVRFREGSAGGGMAASFALWRGNPAITRGSNVYVASSAWGAVTNPRNPAGTMWAEVAHTAQYASSSNAGFESEYVAGVIGGVLTGEGGWGGNIMEVTAHRIGAEMAAAWKNGGAKTCK